MDWAGLAVISTVARLLCRELTLQNECLRLENRILIAALVSKQACPPLAGQDYAESVLDGCLAVECRHSLGGLLNSYYPEAA